MIFVDSNVPMYLVGHDPSLKAETQTMVGRAATQRERLVTSSEVFQEILHRFVSIGRLDAIQPAFATLREIVDHVLPVSEPDIFAAKDLVLMGTGLSARDALHVSVMQHHQIVDIMTFDRGFDVIPGIRRRPGS